VITQPINVNIKDKKILVIDDVADTGKTLNVVINHLLKSGAREIKSAVLQYKKTSEFIPDFSGEILKRWVWIVYPWGILETILGFLPKIEGYNKMSDEELVGEFRKRFKLDIPKNILPFAKLWDEKKS
jgi:hypothetical protein